MELLVNRIKSNNQETLGELYINGSFQCYTLEDEFRVSKKMGETRIPAGRYEIKLRLIGEHHRRYAIRFPGTHKGMLWLQDVPDFEYILIHIGNWDTDTAGCLLVGAGYTETNGRIALTKSVGAYLDMYPRVARQLLSGGKVYITIKDSDR